MAGALVRWGIVGQRAAQKPNSAEAPGASVWFQLTPDALRLPPAWDQVAFHRLLMVPLTGTLMAQLPVALPMLMTLTCRQ